MAAEQTFQAVIFDLVGVICVDPAQLLEGFFSSEKANKEGVDFVDFVSFSELEKEHGLTIGSFHATFIRPEVQGKFAELERGEIMAPKFEDYFVEVYEKQYTKSSLKGLSPIVGTITVAVEEHIRQEMLKAIQIIRSRGLKVALLTNNFLYDEEQLKPTVPFLDDGSVFDVIIESCKIGLRKPDPTIFQHTLQKLVCPSDEVIFLDDETTNVKAAEAMGITAIKVDDPASALDELEQVLGFPLRDALRKSRTMTQL